VRPPFESGACDVPRDSRLLDVCLSAIRIFPYIDFAPSLPWLPDIGRWTRLLGSEGKEGGG